MAKQKTLEKRIAGAVSHFWNTRRRQGARQGSRTGQRDYGNRTAATGGKQLDGFVSLIRKLLIEAGLPPDVIFYRRGGDITLPGYFRPTKQWDVIVAADAKLLASIECKALCGSFANNYNNRVEEAIGSATDVLTAFREGAFEDSPKPFLGYVLLLEDAEESTRPVGVVERHFSVFDEFRDASYAKRCEESLRRLIREQCYDAAAFLMSDQRAGMRGKYHEPAADLKFSRFSTLMCSHVLGAYKALFES